MMLISRKQDEATFVANTPLHVVDWLAHLDGRYLAVKQPNNKIT